MRDRTRLCFIDASIISHWSCSLRLIRGSASRSSMACKCTTSIVFSELMKMSAVKLRLPHFSFTKISPRARRSSTVFMFHSNIAAISIVSPSLSPPFTKISSRARSIASISEFFLYCVCISAVIQKSFFLFTSIPG